MRTDAMMSMDQHLSRPTAADVDRSSVIASIWSGVGLWLRACADYYAAAADYEDLARLSDAELARRGLSRDTLARDVCSRCERGERP
jgi:hypothetical protein